jgi:hypothetical protein
MRLFRVQITPDRSLTVAAPDPTGATMAALQWARDNGEDLFINSMAESVVEIAPDAAIVQPTVVGVDPPADRAGPDQRPPGIGSKGEPAVRQATCRHPRSE